VREERPSDALKLCWADNAGTGEGGAWRRVEQASEGRLALHS
jgi:hypothetical protein